MRDGKKEDKGRDNTKEKCRAWQVLRGKEKETDTTGDYREVMKPTGREGQKEGEGKSKIWCSLP